MTERRRAPFPAAVARAGTRRYGWDAGALVAAAVLAGLASGAKPFTVPADVAVSVPSAMFVGVVVTERLRPGVGPWRRMDRTRPPGVRGSAVPWLVVIAVLVGVELASYFHGGPRADYPTLSSGADALFRYRAVKAAAWFVWLNVGWYLARR